MSRIEAAVAARIAGGTVHSDLDGAQEVAWDAIQDADLSGFVVRIEQAAECLGLDDVSVAVLWFGTAAELDWRLGDVIGFLLGEQGRRRPTVRLTAELLADEELEPATVFASLGADAPLRRHGALCLEGSDAQRPLADQPIEPAPELIAFLRETSLLGAGSDSRLSRREVPDHPVGRPRTLERIRSALHARSDAALLVSGSDGAEMLARAGARGLLLVDARAAGDGELLGRARLIAALENRELAFGYAERLDSDELGALVERFESSGEPLTLWATSPVSELPAIVVEVPMPTLAERREAWAALAGPSIANEVAAKFRLSTVQIARAARIARVEAEMAGRDTPSADDLDAGARRASRSALANRAVRLVSDRAWNDLVLPQRQLEQLHGISAYLRHRDQVLTEWGFERAVSGRIGLGVLFAGESGTGKTMAAKVLAADLGLELFAINLATVVSKYVGETEKNLEGLFGAAEGSNAILLFDEADALFGRRADAADAGDRYANLEVAYLLQRMEAYTGAVILTTNLKQNLDAAFLRRLDFVVDFRFPEAEDRRRMWEMAIPDEAPVADDIDCAFLGERFKLSGGSIRNCSLAAAFAAAAGGQSVRMAHIVRAIAAEYGKLGRLTVESDFGPYLAMLHDPEATPARKAAPPEPETPAPSSRPVRIGSRIEEL